MDSSVLSIAHNIIKRHLWKLSQLNTSVALAIGKDLTEEEKIYMAYLLAKMYLDYRPKHDTKRHGVPYLLDNAQSTYAYLKTQQQQRHNKEMEKK